MRAPEKIIEAATCMFGPHEDVARLAAVEALDAAMASDLGPDRLVVAGPHEQEIIRNVVSFLMDRSDSGEYGEALQTAINEIHAQFLCRRGIGNGIEDDYR